MPQCLKQLTPSCPRRFIWCCMSAPIPFDAELPGEGLDPPPLPPHPAPPDTPFWVFGYGSLMWDPGFPYIEAAEARLLGYHRAFCVWSHHYRGTPECPGLVLGLAPGSSCRGRAFRVAEPDRDRVWDYLYRREMLTGVYDPRWLTVKMASGAQGALAFIVNRHHPQYAGRLSDDVILGHIGRAVGQRGPCADYLRNTVAHLDVMGIFDSHLHRLLRKYDRRRAFDTARS